MRNDEERDIESELISGERELQRQWEDKMILEAKYNKRYKQRGIKEGDPRYLRREVLDKESRGDNVRALIWLRCGNFGKANKYWKEKKDWRCVFCKKSKNNIIKKL